MGLIGDHESIAGGIYNSITGGKELGCEAMQIFTANQRTWNTVNPSKEDIAKYLEMKKKSGIKKVISHDSYLINLASVDRGKNLKSKKAFIEEMKRVRDLEIDGLVFHPGSHTGGTLEQGIKNIIKNMNSALKSVKNFNSKLLIENTAGGGNTIGRNFEDIKRIIDGITDKKKVGVCFDTAHAYEAGYDLKNDYEKVMREFDRVIGFKYLCAFHVNDSKTDLASNVDRHEHIGCGKLGDEPFKKLMKDKRFKDLPMILETPDADGWDERNMAKLKKFRGGQL